MKALCYIIHSTRVLFGRLWVRIWIVNVNGFIKLYQALTNLFFEPSLRSFRLLINHPHVVQWNRNNNNNNMCFPSNLRCCDDLLIMLSRNVFWGATRPLRPAGILRPQFRPTPEVVVVAVVRLPRRQWTTAAVAHARAHQNKKTKQHLIPFSRLLRTNGLDPLQTYLTLSFLHSTTQSAVVVAVVVTVVAVGGGDCKNWMSRWMAPLLLHCKQISIKHWEHCWGFCGRFEFSTTI